MVKFRLIFFMVTIYFLLSVLAIAVHAQTEPPSPYAGLKNPFPWSDTAAQEAGKGLYQQSCSGCHGANGGSITRADFSAPDYAQSLEERPDLSFWILSEGRLDKGMPAYKSSLSEEQRWQTLTYLWSLGAEVAPPVVSPPPEAPAPLDCLSHHDKVLKGHDKLGSGSEACWACHYNTKMTTLHLAGGETQFPLSDFPRLCAQCHQKRYEAWNEGTHGVPAWKEGNLAIRSTEKARCTSCHDPHQPQLVFLNLTKPHPPPQPSPSPPSNVLLVLLGTSLLLVAAIVVAVVTKGELP
jgi:mono/diheme cytochrome c family protein